MRENCETWRLIMYFHISSPRKLGFKGWGTLSKMQAGQVDFVHLFVLQDCVYRLCVVKLEFPLVF